MEMSQQVLLTVSRIAQRLGAPTHHINYIIRARKIKPVGSAGHTYVYSRDAVAQIEQELRLIAERRAASRAESSNAA